VKFSTADPSTICPFCDEEWPAKLSIELTALREKLLKYSKPIKRFRNPEGHTAPISVFIDLCVMHRNETSIIPNGIARGFPTAIDFDALLQRVIDLRDHLQAIITSPKGHFFKMVMEDVKEMGMRRLSGITGQLATFRKVRPG
jgi:hypothetical protein